MVGNKFLWCRDGGYRLKTIPFKFCLSICNWHFYRRISQFRRLLIGGCLQFGLMKVIFSRFVCFFTILKSALSISYARHWLIQVPDIVRSIEEKRVVALRQQSQLLCHMYFSSIDRIIYTTLEVSICCHFIMISFLYWFETLFRLSSKGYNRICGRMVGFGTVFQVDWWRCLITAIRLRDYLGWTPPCYKTSITSPTDLCQVINSISQFTAVIYCHKQNILSINNLIQLLRTISSSQYVHRVSENFTSDLKDKFLVVYWIITILDYSYLG